MPIIISFPVDSCFTTGAAVIAASLVNPRAIGLACAHATALATRANIFHLGRVVWTVIIAG